MIKILSLVILLLLSACDGGSGERDPNPLHLPPQGFVGDSIKGEALYYKKCQVCRGIDGVGETCNMLVLTDKNYLRAPAMNDSEHAWHHTDEALVKTILEGSPRTQRMTAWKNQGLSAQNAQDLVAYIKSLWTQRELDCQRPKHRQCMGQ